ncbi:hypothetical protein BHM03_00017782 [Ensete ventricosum]|nr:hypothetical protein BHM03_00017782 [Ensete ventricosum]
MMTGGHCERLPLVSLVAWATASIGSKQMLSLVPSPWITVYEQAASSAAQQAHLNMAWTWISSSLSWFTGTSKERNFADHDSPKSTWAVISITQGPRGHPHHLDRLASKCQSRDHVDVHLGNPTTRIC